MNKKLIDYLAYLNPKYWIMNYPYNREWDIELNYILDNFQFTDIDRFTAKIAGQRLWTSNHPYANFTIETELATYRASRSTISKANRMYYKFLIIKRLEFLKIELKKYAK